MRGIKEWLRSLVERIKQNSFVKSVLTISSGIVIAQGINVLGTPVLGRLYEPAAIGDYATITASGGVIGSIACLGMMTSFMLPKEDEESRGLCRLVSGTIILFTALSIAGMLLLAPVWQAFQTTIPYPYACLVLGAYIVSYSISTVCYAYVNRQGMYRVLFWNPIVGAGVNIAAGIVFGALGFGFLGYVSAHILSYVACTILLVIKANPYAAVQNPAYKPLALLKAYSAFPKYQMPANLVSALSVQIPVKMIGDSFGSAILGLYSMSMRILSLPINLLATPINRVYYREASERYRNGEDLGEFTFSLLKTNMKLAIIPIGILIVFGEPIFRVFVGEKWAEAGNYAAVLGSHILMSFSSNCIAGGFVIMRKQKWSLCLSATALLINYGAFWISGMLFPNNVYAALIAFAAANIFYNGLNQGLFLCKNTVRLSKYLLFVGQYVFLPVAVAWGIRFVLYRAGLL